ncbi:hypothetical protein [Cyanobium sp. WAJ14-Wanaka]|uniref:hypothetical protein n=1 Tax=Cyanobium sp. WAJ14-Wanaka TaxID=2823725 RepID=UPI0020CF4A97|nr:hypothetical protein [Cyanobium sp. WAJ14-Wanaka]MCP9774756.1 hypothetical protein [Cyanobium sp. WAJ14-Wanaka]
MVATFSAQQAPSQAPGPSWLSSRPARRTGSQARKNSKALELIQGSLSSRKVERQSPWLAGFHRAADGTLVGLGICMLALSGLTLHWQNQWGHQYQQLENSQSLEQRMQESAAVLEQHHLGVVKRPGQLVPTNSENLVYIQAPQSDPKKQATALLSAIQLAPIPPGY